MLSLQGENYIFKKTCFFISTKNLLMICNAGYY